MKRRFVVLLTLICGVIIGILSYSTLLFADNGGSILQKLNNISVLSSTVPSNGDVNPYGLVRVPRTIGNLKEGHYLVSNFNNSSNLQGTGTTIVDVSPNGDLTLFAQLDPNPTTFPAKACPGGIGLTTALAVLRTGWVIVGSLPTTDGTSATAKAGCLIVLDSKGNPVKTIKGSLINGPWDMTTVDGDHQAVLFVTNVLNGTVARNGKVVNQGTVVRVNLAVSENKMPSLESLTVVGQKFSERTDPAALVIGPTGLAISPGCYSNDENKSCRTGSSEDTSVLYVADSLNNRIVVITNPLTRTVPSKPVKILSSGGSLNDPLGMTLAPNGHLLVVNGNDGLVTEITAQGQQIASKLIDNTGSPPGAGALFGVLFDAGQGLVFVDDVTNTLNILK